MKRKHPAYSGVAPFYPAFSGTPYRSELAPGSFLLSAYVGACMALYTLPASVSQWLRHASGEIPYFFLPALSDESDDAYITPLGRPRLGSRGQGGSPPPPALAIR